MVVVGGQEAPKVIGLYDLGWEGSFLFGFLIMTTLASLQGAGW